MAHDRSHNCECLVLNFFEPRSHSKFITNETLNFMNGYGLIKYDSPSVLWLR